MRFPFRFAASAVALAGPVPGTALAGAAKDARAARERVREVMANGFNPAAAFPEPAPDIRFGTDRLAQASQLANVGPCRILTKCRARQGGESLKPLSAASRQRGRHIAAPGSPLAAAVLPTGSAGAPTGAPAIGMRSSRRLPRCRPSPVGRTRCPRPDRRGGRRAAGIKRGQSWESRPFPSRPSPISPPGPPGMPRPPRAWRSDSMDQGHRPRHVHVHGQDPGARPAYRAPAKEPVCGMPVDPAAKPHHVDRAFRIG